VIITFSKHIISETIAVSTDVEGNGTSIGMIVFVQKLAENFE